MFIEWRQNLALGIDLIDEEHEKIVAYLNTLNDALERGSSDKIISDTLSSVMAYTVFHFNHEEELFGASAYPDAQSHINEHQKIARHLASLREALASSPKERVSMELLSLLKDWLVSHIQQMDRTYVQYLQTPATSERK